MRNDVYLKTIWLIDYNSSELYFDFYNRERKYIGYVIVSDKGKITWSIININYIENIRDLIDYVMGNREIKPLSYESIDEIIERWNNSCRYINNHCLVVNCHYYKEDIKTLKKKV